MGVGVYYSGKYGETGCVNDASGPGQGSGAGPRNARYHPVADENIRPDRPSFERSQPAFDYKVVFHLSGPAGSRR